MEFALGHLRWPPAVFWGATLAELSAAQNGYLASKGVDRSVRQMSRSRLDELMRLYPDTPPPGST